MTMIGISLGSIVKIMFWSWASGVATVIGGYLFIRYLFRKNKKG